MTIAAILKHKLRMVGDQPVASVGPSESVAGIARVLSRRRIGAVLVLDQAERLLGIVSERDIVRQVAAHGPQALGMTAAEVMTREVKTASLAMSLPEAMAAMSEGRFRHLPVVDGGRLVGIVSIGDVVTARLREAADEVDSLRAYVAG